MTALIKNYYEILGIRIDATIAEIKKAYKTLAFCYHPDRCKDPDANEKFIEVQRAYETLNDSERKQQYDKIVAGVIEYIKLCDKYKKILSTTCMPFVTQFTSKQQIGNLFDFKNFNITPGMIVDVYDNVFCFIAGHYDDRLIGDVDSPYSYIRYCGQHYRSNSIEQDKNLNTNKRAMECTIDTDKYIFLFEKRDNLRIFIGLYKTDRWAVEYNTNEKRDELVFYLKSVNLDIEMSERFTGKLIGTIHWNRLTTTEVIKTIGYDQQKWEEEFKNTNACGEQDKKLNPDLTKLWKAYNEAKNKIVEKLDRTNQVLGEFGEKIAQIYYDGELYSANHEGSDLKTKDGKEIQVKTRQLPNIFFNSSVTFTNMKFDMLMYLVFHISGEIIQAGEVNKTYVETHCNASNDKYVFQIDSNITKIPDVKDITNDIRKIIEN